MRKFKVKADRFPLQEIDAQEPYDAVLEFCAKEKIYNQLKKDRHEEYVSVLDKTGSTTKFKIEKFDDRLRIAKLSGRAMGMLKVDGIGWPAQCIEAEHPMEAAAKFAQNNNIYGKLKDNGGREFVCVVSAYYEVTEFMLEIINGNRRLTQLGDTYDF